MNYRRVFVQNTYLHIIITSYDRKPVFIDNIDILRTALKNTMSLYKYEIIAICILPEHIHLILHPEDINNYPKIISTIKHYFSRNVGQVCPTDKLKIGYKNKREKRIFQRRYWEHTIRNEEELNNQIDYIHYNPVKHGYAQNVKDWKHSSFHKFVTQGYYKETWGSFEDTKNIQHLDFE
ncbi:MAG: transposase [Muribaculaceae bacterium]|nr:transposase [Muribaculaceae bacterium]